MSVDQLFGGCRGQREGLDEFDLEAVRDGDAIRAFRQYAVERAASKAQMKRKVVRGSIGAGDRKGLVAVGRG